MIQHKDPRCLREAILEFRLIAIIAIWMVKKESVTGFMFIQLVTMWRRAPGWWVMAGLSAIVACSATDDKRLPVSGLTKTGAPSAHAIQDARLRNLMREINHLMFERMRTELEIDQARRRKAAQIGQTAQEMAQTVAGIADSLPRLSLEADQQAMFLTLVDQLQNEIRMLKTQAGHNYIDAIPGTLERIATVCTQCHALFRETADGRAH